MTILEEGPPLSPEDRARIKAQLERLPESFVKVAGMLQAIARRTWLNVPRRGRARRNHRRTLRRERQLLVALDAGRTALAARVTWHLVIARRRSETFPLLNDLVSVQPMTSTPVCQWKKVEMPSGAGC